MPIHLKPLYSPAEIQSAVNKLASEIRRDYEGKSPLVVGVLKGSFIFLSDLVRALNIPLEIDFIRAASYGNSDVSSGNVRITKDIDASVENRDVIVVEDIVDTGLTLNVILKHLKGENPASLKLCALVDKLARRELPIKIDYLGFSIEDGFLVGYGLDYKENYRYLPGVYVMKEG